MKLSFALLAGLLISTSASAETFGTFTREQRNSETLTIVLKTEKSTHPECNGRREAISFTTDRGMDFRQARGCWDLPNSSGRIPVHLFRYSDGSEIAASIDRNDLKLSDRAEQSRQNMVQVTGSVQVADKRTISADEMSDAALSTPDKISMYYAGVCEAMRLAEATAQTAEQKKMAEAIRDAIIKTTDTEAPLVDDYCDAKSRMFHTAKN